MSLVSFRYIDQSDSFQEESFSSQIKRNAPYLERVQRGEECYSAFMGWHDVDEWAGEEWLDRYEEMASEIKESADALVVIGVGGSNQAARAVYEGLGKRNGVEIFWAGNTISAYSLNCVLARLDEKKSIYVNCIAKNFETLEPGLAFRAMRGYLKNRYGEGYNSRLIVTFTLDTFSWQMAEKNGFKTLPFPKNISGRYTSLSPICLFPLAVAGFDIRRMKKGAKEMEIFLKNTFGLDNPALKYATARTMLKEKGKAVELLSFFEPRLFRFGKWWKQLFGESEGKGGKALLPMDALYTEDLHSLGQFIQDGSPVLFETFLNIRKTDSSYILHPDEVEDRFSYVDEMDFAEINRAAFEATLSAHSKRFPCLIIEIEEMNEETFGSIFYFFQFACYISCSITGVNPFNQDGVEAYKNDMFKILGKGEKT